MFELKYRLNNGSRCFDKRVFVFARHLEQAKDITRTALIQKYGNEIKLNLLAYKCHNDLCWIEPDWKEGV